MISVTIQFNSAEEMLEALLSLAENAGKFQEQLDRIEGTLDKILENERNIMANEQQMQDALNKIDQATTRAGQNLQTLSTTTQKISDEVDQFISKLQDANVPQNLIDQATGLADRLQTVSDGLDQHATFLSAIASKGASNPVPVPVPPAPTDGGSLSPTPDTGSAPTP
jgi:DNA repair exonuclease SbcCD ATPase subunit